MDSKATIESQKSILLQDRQLFQQNIQQRMEAIDRLSKEIEQCRGMLTYNELCMKRLDEALNAFPKTE